MTDTDETLPDFPSFDSCPAVLIPIIVSQIFTPDRIMLELTAKHSIYNNDIRWLLEQSQYVEFDRTEVIDTFHLCLESHEVDDERVKLIADHFRLTPEERVMGDGLSSVCSQPSVARVRWFLDSIEPIENHIENHNFDVPGAFMKAVCDHKDTKVVAQLCERLGLESLDDIDSSLGCDGIWAHASLVCVKWVVERFQLERANVRPSGLVLACQNHKYDNVIWLDERFHFTPSEMLSALYDFIQRDQGMVLNSIQFVIDRFKITRQHVAAYQHFGLVREIMRSVHITAYVQEWVVAFFEITSAELQFIKMPLIFASSH